MSPLRGDVQFKFPTFPRSGLIQSKTQLFGDTRCVSEIILTCTFIYTGGVGWERVNLLYAPVYINVNVNVRLFWVCFGCGIDFWYIFTAFITILYINRITGMCLTVKFVIRVRNIKKDLLKLPDIWADIFFIPSGIMILSIGPILVGGCFIGIYSSWAILGWVYFFEILKSNLSIQIVLLKCIEALVRIGVVNTIFVKFHIYAKILYIKI